MNIERNGKSYALVVMEMGAGTLLPLNQRLPSTNKSQGQNASHEYIKRNDVNTIARSTNEGIICCRTGDENGVFDFRYLIR